MDWLMGGVSQYSQTPFDLTERVSRLYLFTTVLMAFAIWHGRGHPRSLVAHLLPRDVYRDNSNLLDIKRFPAHRVLAVGGCSVRSSSRRSPQFSR